MGEYTHWIIFNIFVSTLLIFDLYISKGRVYKFKSSLIWSLAWISISMAVAFWFFIEDGPKLTRSRFKSLISQLDKLNKQKMDLAGDIQNDREDGDVRENAPLEAAREAQAMVMAKITYI